MPQPPQADRVESDDDHVPVRTQYAIHLSQHAVRIFMSLQEVRQQDDIDRIVGDTQAIRRSDEFNVLSGMIVSDRRSLGTGHIAKGLATPASELKELIAKYAAQSRANTPTLLPQQGSSGTRFEPVGPGHHDLQLPASAHYD